MQWVLWSPLLVAAALLAAGSIAIMLLPEMAHKPLEDTIEGAQDSEVVTTALVVPPHRASSTGCGTGQYNGGGTVQGAGDWATPLRAVASADGAGWMQRHRGTGSGLELAPLDSEGHAVAHSSLSAQSGEGPVVQLAEERLGLLRGAASNPH
jgi:hypothetical protein